MAAVWLILVGADGSMAQTPPIYQFGEIVVTADGPRVVEEVTTVDVVTAEEIDRAGARTLDEALELLPGLQLRRGAEGIVLLDVRGLRARNVLLLLDGVPINASLDGLFDPTTLPLTAVARIELTRGASSVLYGPTGNAGVVDVVTRAAPPSNDAALLVEGGDPASTRVAGRASWRRGDLGLVVSGTFFETDGFDLSDDFESTALEDGGERLASDREDRSILLGLTSTPEDGTRWGVTLGYRGGERGKPPATEDFRTSIFAPRTRFERVDADTLSLHAGLSTELGRGLTLRPTAFVNRTESLTDGFDDATFSSQVAAGAFRQDATASTSGAGLQLAWRRPAGSLFTLGVDVRRERWRAEGFELVASDGGNGGGGNGGGGTGGGGTGGGGNGGGGNG
ncbi:MAG: TonB-dependent receptor plug domain-containing protein, partial [Acidobacteriota bacterium]